MILNVSINNTFRRYISYISTLVMPLCIGFAGGATGLSFVNSYSELPFDNPKVWDIEASVANNWAFFGTDNGVLAFDGNLWDHYHLNNKSEVRSVAFDDVEGRLYVGGINEFGYFAPSAVGSLEYICLSDSVPEQKFVGNVWGIHIAGNTLYVQGDHEILTYDLKNPDRSTMAHSENKLNCSDLINNTLYLGTETGVRRMESGNIVEVAGMEALADSRIRGIMPGMNGIIITTSNSGIFVYKNSSVQRITFATDIEGEVFTSAITKNKLALGTIGKGLYLIDLEKGNVDIYNESNGLAGNTILSLAFDENGNLWIGEDGGVEMVIVDMPLTTLSNARLSIGYGYTSMVHNGRLWLGTNRGLYSLPWPLKYPLNFEQMPGIEGQTWNLKKIGDRLMLCHDHGLFEILSADRYKKVNGPTGVWDIQSKKGNSDKVLIGAYDGLYIADVLPGGFGNVARIGGFSSCPSFAQESDSVVWLSDGSEGFTRMCVDFASGEVLSTDKYVMPDGDASVGIVVEPGTDDRLLFCTETGIYRFKPSSKRFVIDEYVAPYLKAGRKYLGVKEVDNWVYIVSDSEFLQANVITREVSSMPLVNNRIIARHYGDLINVVDETTVILPTNKGYIFAEFEPGAKAIDKISLNPNKINMLYTTNSGDSLHYRSNYLDVRPNIELDYAHNSVKIVYGSAEMSRDGMAVYRYKLNDENWSALTQETVKEFTALDPGEYTFTVETTYNDGGVATDEISFSILPPWWLTNVAKIIYCVLLLGATVLIVKVVQRRVKRHERELVKEQEAEILRQKIEFQEKERQQQVQIAMLERDKMQLDYNRKSQELTNLLMSEANKNDLLQEVKDELSKTMNSPLLSADQRAMIGKLYEKIKLGSHTEKVLERVEEEFNLLHNNFTQKLRQKFPSLTNAEIILCAYIKMNLPTKEIAPLINISLRGVETMRYRVRKKLGLNRNDSLSGFIANF